MALGYAVGDSTHMAMKLMEEREKRREEIEKNEDEVHERKRKEERMG